MQIMSLREYSRARAYSRTGLYKPTDQWVTVIHTPTSTILQKYYVYATKQPPLFLSTLLLGDNKHSYSCPCRYGNPIFSKTLSQKKRAENLNFNLNLNRNRNTPSVDLWIYMYMYKTLSIQLHVMSSHVLGQNSWHAIRIVQVIDGTFEY